MTTAVRRCALAIVLFLLGAAVFAAAYCQAPLYYSNQNQYFLHGLADAGCGELRHDWLANTRDPTPVFTALVAVTVRFLHPLFFHVYYALLFGAYAAAMLGLFVSLAGPAAARRWPVFLALLVVVHCALGRWASYRWLGHDYPWFLQAGVAGQYVLGAMFQPSSFGVLLVVAVALFVLDRPYLVAVAVALAATLHPSYLLPGALLMLGFLAALAREGRARQAIGTGALALVLVLPVVLYSALTFRPTDPETFDRAQDILVNLRIPHHTRPDRWFDPVAALQIGWVVLALVLVWRTRLFLALAVPFVLATLLTLLQVFTGSHTLALLFPWRVSAVLVPVATTVVLTRLVCLPRTGLDGPVTRAVCAAVVGALVAAGVWITAARLAFQNSDDEVGMMAFVRDSLKPGDVYFVPVKVPDLTKTPRGSLSTDFEPIKDKQRDPRAIPPGLQPFRLATGAPILVDFKSVPYKDVEVLQWEQRIQLSQAVQQHLQEGRLSKAVSDLRAAGVTHLVTPAGWELTGAGFKEVYRDPHYRIYRLSSAAEGP